MTLEKFTKEEVFKLLKQVPEMYPFADADTEKLFVDMITTNFKPQKGGGATANPPKVIDGITYHYCRCFKDYLPEDEMVFSQDKCKGISKIGQKHSYELSKLVNEKNMEALKCYQAGDIENGMRLTQEAKDIEASKDEPATYVAERERQLAESAQEETTTDTVEL